MSTDLIKPTGSALPLLRQTLSGSTMGTRYSCVFYVRQGMKLEALAAALFQAVDRIDRQMSTWNPQSDLNRLNAAPIDTWIEVPRELMTVLAASLRIGRTTEGAFDIGVGDIVSAWGFGASAARTDQARKPVAMLTPRPITTHVLELDEAGGKVRKTAPLQLDLSGIAKGYGVDEMARVMNQFAIPAWLVGIDGEMRAKGLKPDGVAWAVAHERPDRNIREAMGVIELTDMAVATSGNYRHWIEVDGRILSHTMSGRSGGPIENSISSVTVLAPTCMAADAWATAFMVMGVDAGTKTAKTLGMDVIFVLGDGEVTSTL